MVSTAIGRRRQLFSPSPDRNGRRSKAPITMTGPMSRAGVSMDGGRKERTAYSHKKKKSGFGEVWMMVGSGWPVGPKGPKNAAQAGTANRINAAKNRSFHTA